MPHGGIHFCVNPMPTSCLSMSVLRVHLNCVYEIFIALSSVTTHHRCLNFKHSSFWHAIWWDSFLCESDADFLFIRASVRRVYMKFSSQIPQQLLIADAWKFSTFFLLACTMVGLIHFCVNPMTTSCLSVRLSEECLWNIVYMEFSLQFSQQLLIADASNFNTLFLLAYNMVGFIVVWIRCRLPVYPCICP
jgi:hypothetical protein